MKPNKRQRNKIYRNTLRRVQEEGWNYGGFCWNLELTSLRIGLEIDTYLQMSINFPEIWKRRPPRGVGRYWWDVNEEGYKKREKILKLAIKETNSKKKSNEKSISSRRGRISKGKISNLSGKRS